MSRISLALFLVTIFLSTIGIFILYESSSYTALLNIGDKYYFIKNQIIWVLLGIVVSLVVSRFPYKKLHVLSLPALIFSIILLILVFIPGIGLELKGSNRWIDLRFLILQPSELLKISLSLYLAAWLSNKEKIKLVTFLLLFGVCTLLIAMEPDLGTALIVASTSIVVYFLSGAKIQEMLLIFVILVSAAILFIKIEPYRVARLSSFSQFDERDLSTTSYHVKQILIALGSGGLTGVGLGNSIQKYAYLPENTTDSIFAIYAEETGFVGSVFLLLVLMTQTALGIMISIQAKDPFGRLLASGIVTFLGVQSLINIASQVVLVPLTGVPLPFISYGGSSMIINFMSIGVLLSIANSLKLKPKSSKK